MDIDRDKELRALYQHFQGRGISEGDQLELAAQFIGASLAAGIECGQLSERRVTQTLKRLHKFMQRLAGVRA